MSEESELLKKEIIEHYHCDSSCGEDCGGDCDICRKCLSDDLDDFEKEVRAEAVEEVEVLIRQFTREWNMTNHKRISYIASDELISYLRNHMKEQSNAK